MWAESGHEPGLGPFHVEQRATLRLPLVAFICLLTATPALADVVIGVVAPLSGRYAQQGEAIRSSIERAVDKANTSGGIAGQTIRIVVQDDRCDAKAGAEAASQLVAQMVPVVVGHPCAGSALAAAPVYARSHTLMLALTTHPDLTDKRAGPTIFRMAGRDDHQGTAIARHIADHFADERVVLVHDRTRYASAVIQRALTELGRLKVTVAATEGIIAGEKDYSALVERIRASGAHIVAFAGFPAEAAAILRLANSSGLSIRMIGTESLASG